MKKHSIFLILLLLCLGLCQRGHSADAQEDLVIVTGRQSSYSIVLPDDSTEMAMKAATFLQSVIEESSGAHLEIVKESAYKGDKGIYLGKTVAAKKAGIKLSEIKGWHYLNQVVGQSVFLVGADGLEPIQEEREALIPKQMGLWKAAVSFVETEMKARFVASGSGGWRIPKHPVLRVRSTLKDSRDNVFEYVIGSAPRMAERAEDQFPMLMIANMDGYTPVLKSYGGHSYYDAVPETKYAKSHPEYFALIGGKRVTQGNHLCISNPEVLDLMVQEMERQLDKGYQWIELAQTDGYQDCECEKCLAIHNLSSERLWITHRNLAEIMMKRRPGKKVMIISYGPTVKPPVSFDKFPSNVVIQLCSYTPESLAVWEPFKVKKTAYLYNWGLYQACGFGPSRTPEYVQKQINLFRKHDVCGIYLCGGWNHLGSYYLSLPSLYTFGKLLQDPGLDVKALVNDYLEAAFGEAATPMKGFYASMHARVQAYSLFSVPALAVGDFGNPKNDENNLRSPEDYYILCFPPKTIGEMAARLQQAKEMAQDEKVKAFIKGVEIEFSYIKVHSELYHLYRGYRSHPTVALMDALALKVEERKKVLDQIYPGGAPIPIKGLPLAFAGLDFKRFSTGGANSGVLNNRPPLNWDFDLLKKNNVLPGTGVIKRFEAIASSGIKMDGLLDEEDWKKVPFQELAEIGMGAGGGATRFKVLYDQEAVYFGIECEVQDISKLEGLVSKGRDGDVFGQESIELVLDGFGNREKHCQLVFNPIKDSTYDAQLSYIDDPVHPLYGKRDSSWNGEWQYVPKIDVAAKRWTVEVRVPVKTLGVPGLKSGSRWTFNVCRSESLSPKGADSKHAELRLSTWAPNLESRNFHDRATFGELIFK